MRRGKKFLIREINNVPKHLRGEIILQRINYLLAGIVSAIKYFGEQRKFI